VLVDDVVTVGVEAEDAVGVRDWVAVGVAVADADGVGNGHWILLIVPPISDRYSAFSVSLMAMEMGIEKVALEAGPFAKPLIVVEPASRVATPSGVIMRSTLLLYSAT
jgi:hypothetical protein